MRLRAARCLPGPAVGPAVPSLTFANNQTIDYMGTDAGAAPYQENWSLTVERELPWRMGLEVSYVGSAGHKLGAELENLDQVNSKYLSLGNDLNADIGCVSNGTCPLAIAAGVRLPYAGFTGPISQALRPFPQFDGINSNVQETGNSSYHALQVRLQKYYSNGVSLIVAYTASKNLTTRHLSLIRSTQLLLTPTMASSKKVSRMTTHRRSSR